MLPVSVYTTIPHNDLRCKFGALLSQNVRSYPSLQGLTNDLAKIVGMSERQSHPLILRLSYLARQGGRRK